MPFIEGEGVRLNYLALPFEGPEAQRGEAETLILIHGLATNMAFWYMSVAPALRQRFNVVLYDLRGHGKSSMPVSGYRPEDAATDLELLCDQLGIEECHIMAHSFGSVVALTFALRNRGRIASLVLADAHITAVRALVKETGWAFSAKVQAVLDGAGLELSACDPYLGYRLLKLVPSRYPGLRGLPRELEAIINPLLGAVGNKTIERWIRLLDTTSAERELLTDDGLLLPELRKIDAPVLAFYGERSQSKMTGETLLKVWPHARFVCVRQAGHFFPVTHPGFVVDESLKFWERRRTLRVATRVSDPASQNHFRSSRFEEGGEGWYIKARGGQRIGPFTCRENAERYCREVLQGRARGRSRLAVGEPL